MFTCEFMEPREAPHPLPMGDRGGASPSALRVGGANKGSPRRGMCCRTVVRNSASSPKVKWGEGLRDVSAPEPLGGRFVEREIKFGRRGRRDIGLGVDISGRGEG